MSAVKPPTSHSKKEEMSEYILQIYTRVAEEEKALKKVKAFCSYDPGNDEGSTVPSQVYIE